MREHSQPKLLGTPPTPLAGLDIAHALAPVLATDLEGRPIRLGALWEARPVVLVFLRHFG